MQGRGPYCKNSFEIAETGTSPMIKCPGCGQSFELPRLEPLEPLEPSAAAPGPGAAAPPAAAQKGGGNTALKLIGCGCLTLIILGAVGGYFMVTNFRRLAANAARTVAVSAIRNSQMPKATQDGLIQQIDRVTGAYKRKEISLNQVAAVMEALAKSPLIPMALVNAADVKYVQPSGLGVEEKKRGSIELQRFGRGVVEDKIKKAEIDAALDLISVKKGDNERQLKQKLTDEEVRTFLAKVKETADAHQIPDEPYKIDPVAEFKKMVDKALEKK